MRIFSRIFFYIMTILIIACGGNDQDSNITPNIQTKNVADNNSDTISINLSDPVSTTSELIVPNGFSFSTTYSIYIDIDISHLSSTRAYLSICGEFTLDAYQDITVDYESCILRTGMNNGIYTGDIQVPNDKEQLVIAIWFYDANIAPSMTLWNKNNANSNTIIVR